MIEMFFGDGRMFTIEINDRQTMIRHENKRQTYSSRTSIGATPTFLIKRNSCGIIVSGKTMS